MCGIAGVLSLRNDLRPDAGCVDRMLRSLAHRGPDDQDLYVDSRVAIGYRRLAILDLREVANQPMPNEDGTIQAVFNGEIYNFRELRADLVRRGHCFRSAGDTETIVHLYEEHGLEFVQRLRGMFAVALWDTKRRRLVLVRDRLGKKPIFYLRTPELFAFASEIKALLAANLVPRRIDPIAIDQFLSLQYVPAPRTGFEDIRKLPAATLLALEADTVSEHRYWTLDYEPKRSLTEAEAGDHLLSLLRESVRLRMISDVPLGAFLSGGLDSGSVVGLMAEQTAHVKTFSIGFREPSFDELRYARAVAQHFGTDHHEAIVEPNAIHDVPQIVWHYDQPFADVSALPTYYLSKLAAGHVKVALNGDGGDEDFAGYPRYAQFMLTAWVDRLPNKARDAFGAVATHITRLFAERNYLARRAYAVAAALNADPEARYAAWVTAFQSADKERLLSPELRETLAGSRGTEPLLHVPAQAKATVDKLLELDMRTYLPDDLLVKVDIASMACSLECRSPYLDHKVVEFAAQLPAQMKLRRGTSKRLLKQVFRDRLPEGIADRPKQGFGVPIGDWLRRDLRDYAPEILLGSRARQRGLFSISAVAELLNEHQSGRFNHSRRLWPLLVLEIWLRTFFDSDGARPLSIG
jgi:asparagine synthase (glutamine-hydrolysing)